MHAETLVLESVWNGTKSHNGGQLMVAAEEKPMAKELITKGADGWGFETLDGRKAGFPSRDAARAARKIHMDTPPTLAEVVEAVQEHNAAKAVVEELVADGENVKDQLVAALEQLATVTTSTPVATKPIVLKKRKGVTADEVTAVLNLRGAGMSFQRIEAELGWDDYHGCKARRICLDAAAAHAAAEGK